MLAALALAATLASTPQTPPVAASLRTALDQLGSFDFDTRTEAARVVRRARAGDVVPLLTEAALHHADEYVRFRAFVLLTAIDDRAAEAVAASVLGDPNDRVRMVAYQWFEHHPRPDVVPKLLAALETEQSEFVRPALTRALAAVSTDARVERVLLPLVLRGEDIFRGAVIEALGAYGRRAALADITQVAQLDGPLQDDAITALGRIGDPSSRQTLAALQQSAPRELQPTVSAALCLLTIDCDARMAYLRSTLAFAVATPGYQPLLRGAVHALAVLAIAGRADAMAALIDAAVSSPDTARAPIALGIGTVALRNADVLFGDLEGRADPRPAIGVLRDAFDELSEDFEEERFGLAVRTTLGSAPAGSASRRLADVLTTELEY